MIPTDEVSALIDRSLYDLVHGWPEAAQDALGRAARAARESARDTDRRSALLRGIAASHIKHETARHVLVQVDTELWRSLAAFRGAP